MSLNRLKQWPAGMTMPVRLPVDALTPDPAAANKIPADLLRVARLVPLAFSSYGRLDPAPLPAPLAASAAAGNLINWRDAKQALFEKENVAVLSGRATLAGNTPWAANYSGHQFGVFAGQLGDGRALSLGVLQGDAAGWEMQLKGAGRTPYSRMGDGFATLRASIREFLCSEFLAAVRVPTTRALAVVATGRAVERGEGALEPGAIVCRLSQSWIRFGSFEGPFYRARAAQARGDKAAAAAELALVKQLADAVIADFYRAECSNTVNPYETLLRVVSERTAALVAAWQALGFCHGVLNTDNMSVLGVTLDLGPFGLVDGYNPHHVCNSSDDGGRYALDQQPAVALWNLVRFARTLLHLLDADAAAAASCAEAVLEQFRPAFEREYRARMLAKFGLGSIDGGDGLVQPFLDLLALGRIDYTRAFRALCDLPEWLSSNAGSDPVERLLMADLARAASVVKAPRRAPTAFDRAVIEQEREAFPDRVAARERYEEFVGRPLAEQQEQVKQMWEPVRTAFAAAHGWRDDPPSTETAKTVAQRMRRANPRVVLRNWICNEVASDLASLAFDPATGAWVPTFDDALSRVWSSESDWPPELAKVQAPLERCLRVLVGDPYGAVERWADPEDQAAADRWAGPVPASCGNVQCSCSS